MSVASSVSAGGARKAREGALIGGNTHDVTCASPNQTAVFGDMTHSCNTPDAVSLSASWVLCGAPCFHKDIRIALGNKISKNKDN